MEFDLPADLTTLSNSDIVAKLGSDQFSEYLTTLSADSLAALEETAVATFDSRVTANSLSTDDEQALTVLADSIDAVRAEQTARIEAAKQAAARLDALSARVRGDQPVTASADTDDDSGDTGQEPEQTAPEPAPVATASATPAVRRAPIDLSVVQRHQPRVLPQPSPQVEIMASVDVPGYSPGQPLNTAGVTEGIIRRASALATAGGGVGLTASYRLPFEDSLIVKDGSAATEGTRSVIHAADQSRLPARNGNAVGGTLTASGGWCAPSENIYELTQIACPDMLWQAPEIQLARGGIRYYKVPSLDVSSMTWVHTEADDIAGNNKPCYKIPCPDPVEVRCDAVGVCLEAGILTQRHFPELVEWYQQSVMVAHELRIRDVLFQQALTQATPVVLPETFGALSSIYSAIALQAADMIERHSLCDSISIEVTLPWWSRSLMLADLARQNGRSLDEVHPQQLNDLFATLGVALQWSRNLGPAVPAQIGGDTPALGWPGEIQMLIYVAGSLQIGRGGEISLGVIHDSTKFATNDFTAIFSEECVALINRGPDLRLVTLPICPSGATGAQTALTCTGGEESPGDESPAA